LIESSSAPDLIKEEVHEPPTSLTGPTSTKEEEQEILGKVEEDIRTTVERLAAEIPSPEAEPESGEIVPIVSELRTENSIESVVSGSARFARSTDVDTGDAIDRSATPENADLVLGDVEEEKKE
jgi:hypothetical protein